jgi:putative oxidoreductase
MALFTLGTALGFHSDFQNQDMWTHFWKNISIIGGFLLAASVGSGGFTLDAYLARARAAGPAQG